MLSANSRPYMYNTSGSGHVFYGSASINYIVLGYIQMNIDIQHADIIRFYAIYL